MGAIWDGTYTIREEDAQQGAPPIAVGLTEANAKHICDAHNALLKLAGIT